MTPETIEKLKISKMNRESEARTCGESQAEEIIEKNCDYDLLCRLRDEALMWKTNEDYSCICLANIELGEYPEPLNFHLADGFYSAVLQMHEQLHEQLKAAVATEAGHDPK